MNLCDRCKNKCKFMLKNKTLDTCGLFEKQTNFDRITASHEKLSEFIHEAESVYERCAKGDLRCDYCECQWCGLAGRKDLIDWLNEEWEK